MKVSIPDVVQHYKKIEIETASREKKLTVLHERCVDLIVASFVKPAEVKRCQLNKAQNILSQLEAALRIDDEVSKSLYYIYDYAYVLLERGRSDDCKKAIEVMSVIRDTFRTLLKGA